MALGVICPVLLLLICFYSSYSSGLLLYDFYPSLLHETVSGFVLHKIYMMEHVGGSHH